MSAMHFDAETGTRTDEAMPDDAIRYSRGRNKFDASPEQRVAADFDAFEQAFLADRSTKKGQTFVCAAFRINGDGRPHRGKDEALPRAFLPFDLDAIPDADTFNELRQWFTGYRGFGYTTASHRPDAPRCRIVLAADRAMSRDEGQRACLAIQRRVERDFGPGVLKFDENVYRAEQPLFTPLHGAMDFRFLGEPVNVDELLAEVPPEAESPSGKRNEPGAHTDWLAALLEGDDVHGNACRLIGRWVALGWDDATIRATMDALAIGVAAARGRERADELLGEELDRMIEGARRNGYDKPRNGAGAAQPGADDAEQRDDDEIDGESLLALDLPETHYLCRPWIPEGVTILAGRPKIGKTTLLRQIAVCASSGSALWGRPCSQAEVLFLSLEEGKKLMRKKLLLAGYAGAQLRCIRFHWRWRAGAAGVADIRARIEANPRIRFVIVDSLTRFRDAPTRDKPQFHQDYEAVRLLADIVKDFPGLSIIVLHHTKKDQGDDPIADISGTFGLTAAADNYMVMRREAGEYVLHCGGRYWDEAEDAFRLRRDGGAWSLEGIAAPVRLSPMQRQYLDVLRAEGTVTTRGMARRFSVRDNTASEILAELQAKGLADRTADGWRAVIPHTETPESGGMYE